ncbi:MAG TPA: myxococcus cysteine-rich repeat containing protein [Kofleriaceae bacterium]
MRWTCALLILAACGSHNGATGGGDDDGTGDGGIGSGSGSASALCGNGVLDPGEQCDDGNTVSGDGCSSTCQLEAGSGSDVVCSPHSFRCGSNDDVEVCNNAGTAWLFEQSCSSGCSGGVCQDPTCTPGATRCEGNEVQTCSADGSTWSNTQSCASTFCQAGQCALDQLMVGSNSNYDGTVIVAGNFDVGNGSTLTASSGDLTIIADSITVEAGAAIAVAPTSNDVSGESCYFYYTSYDYGYEVANYGNPAGNNSTMVVAVGGENESAVQGGGFGGASGLYGCDAGSAAVTTHGGGTLRLIATHDITIAGQLLAPGQVIQTNDPSGGAGGGIELAGDTIEVTGSISTTGGNTAGYGRIRLMYGTSLANTGTTIGDVTQGRRPPIDVTSPTQPNSSLVYNDNFTTMTVSHERPFTTAQGYMHSVDTNPYTLPTPATGTFSGVETFGVAQAALVAGQNYVHVIPLDASSAFGAVETTLPITINTAAPAASSTSHPSATTWYANANPFFQWTLPSADASFARVHYVFDNFGDTIPTTSDTALPASQKQLLVSNVANGIWVLHVISEDTVGNLTKIAAHVVVRVGTDPGTGTVFGSVFDENDQPVVGATVRVNRGLFTATTTTGGAYTINGVSAGTWEISVVEANHHVAPQTLTVTASGSSSASFNLIHN